MNRSFDTSVSLPILGEVDVDAIYRNPKVIEMMQRRDKVGAMRRACIVIDQESVEIAKRIGEGNLSAGIRLALKDFA